MTNWIKILAITRINILVNAFVAFFNIPTLINFRSDALTWFYKLVSYLFATFKILAVIRLNALTFFDSLTSEFYAYWFTLFEIIAIFLFYLWSNALTCLYVLISNTDAFFKVFTIFVILRNLYVWSDALLSRSSSVISTNWFKLIRILTQIFFDTLSDLRLGLYALTNRLLYALLLFMIVTYRFELIAITSVTYTLSNTVGTLHKISTVAKRTILIRFRLYKFFWNRVICLSLLTRGIWCFYFLLNTMTRWINIFWRVWRFLIIWILYWASWSIWRVNIFWDCIVLGKWFFLYLLSIFSRIAKWIIIFWQWFIIRAILAFRYTIERFRVVFIIVLYIFSWI